MMHPIITITINLDHRPLLPHQPLGQRQQEERKQRALLLQKRKNSTGNSGPKNGSNSGAL